MKRSDKFANPFYALLLVVGITFALTATAYGVMAFRESRPPATTQTTVSAATHPLLEWMSEHGETALLTELALLAAFVVGAIGTDDYWQRRTNRR